MKLFITIVAVALCVASSITPAAAYDECQWRYKIGDPCGYLPDGKHACSSEFREGVLYCVNGKWAIHDMCYPTIQCCCTKGRDIICDRGKPKEDCASWWKSFDPDSECALPAANWLPDSGKRKRSNITDASPVVGMNFTA